MSNEIKLKIMYVYIFLQPILDLATSLMTKYIDTPITLGVLVRGLLLLLCCYYLMFKSKSSYNKISKIYLIFLLIYFLGYFLTKLYMFNNLSYLTNEITYIFKYYYTIIMFVFVINFFDEYKPNYKKLITLLIVNMILYCAIILLANITNTAFATYLGGYGNTGWYYSGNEISNVLILLFPLVFLFVNKITSYYSLILIIPIILAISFIGTKTSFLGLLIPTILVLLYNFIKFKKINKNSIVISVITLITILMFSANSFVFQNIKNSILQYKPVENNDVTSDKPGSKDEFITDVLMSNRDRFQKNIKEVYNKSDLKNKLFGVGFTTKKEFSEHNIEKLIEMDFLDIFYRYGIIGFIIYFSPFLLFLYFIVKLVLKININLTVNQLFLGYSSFIGICVSYIVGHTLGAPTVSTSLILLLIICMYYLKNDNYSEKIINNKITILGLHLGIGGVEKYIQSLCEMLVDKYEIEVILTYKMPIELTLNKKVKVKYLINDYPQKEEFKNSIKSHNLFKFLKHGYSLMKILVLKYIKNLYEITNINSKYIITTRVFHNNLIKYIKNDNNVLIATEHNYHNNNQKYIKKVIKSCHNIDYLITVSEELQQFYQPLLNKTKCIYIPNVIDNIPEFLSEKSINNRLVSIGRLSEEKGYDDLINIVKIIKQEIPNINLDIYGDGQLKNHLNNKIKQNDLSKNINLCGFISNEKLLNNLIKYDIYLMTSLTESFGIVLLEAMSRSLPCIAFDSASGARYLLKNNKGILISNRDIDLYASEVIRLLKNEKTLSKIRKSGYESIKKYDKNKIKKTWFNLLEKI